ncbi:MAG: RNA polymerase sigma factor [Sinobacterium sp.]
MERKPNKRQSKPSGIGVSLISKTFLENSSFLKKFLGRFLSERQDIEDVVQETYLRAYKAEQHSDEPNKAIEYPKAFLFQIAKNLALTELSKKSRRITDYIEDVELSLVLDNGSTTEEELEAREHIDIICEAVTSMPERRQRIYLMRKVHGASHKDIANSFGISISAVEKHLLKAMLTCRDYIREREEVMDGSSAGLNSNAVNLPKADMALRQGPTKKNVEL